MQIPKHVALIMDGNGRWATQKNLPRSMGHKKGADAFEKTVKYALKIGIQVLSVFAFSTENFKRPKQEVDAILDLMRAYIKSQNRKQNAKIRLRFIGDLSPLPVDIQQGVKELELRTQNNSQLTLNIAFNYGGRQDILFAARSIAEQYLQGEISSLDSMTEQLFSGFLATAGQPDVDLLIRTSGEQRISNFLLWQCAYAEFVFLEVLWPDFSSKHFDHAIEVFQSRDRRMGGVS